MDEEYRRGVEILEQNYDDKCPHLQKVGKTYLCLSQLREEFQPGFRPEIGALVSCFEDHSCCIYNHSDKPVEA